MPWHKTRRRNSHSARLAEAYAKRNVPTYVFGAGDGDTPTGGDQEAQLLQQLLAMEYAKRLDYDRAIQK